jgi:hypothetical protein
MNSQPRKAMEKGLTPQLMNSVTPMPRLCFLTWCSAPKSIFSSIGMIITHTSTPTGMLTLAISRLAMAWNTPGKNWPSSTPAMMHNATHMVR